MKRFRTHVLWMIILAVKGEYGSGHETATVFYLVLLSIDSKNQVTRQPQFHDLTHIKTTHVVKLLLMSKLYL